MAGIATRRHLVRLADDGCIVHVLGRPPPAAGRDRRVRRLRAPAPVTTPALTRIQRTSALRVCSRSASASSLDPRGMEPAFLSETNNSAS